MVQLRVTLQASTIPAHLPVTKHILCDKVLRASPRLVTVNDTEECVCAFVVWRSAANPLWALQGPGIVLRPNPICTFPASASHRATITHDTFNHITHSHSGSVFHASVFTHEVRPNPPSATVTVPKEWMLFNAPFRDCNDTAVGIMHPYILWRTRWGYSVCISLEICVLVF